jgi:hypothetical protein
MDLIFGLLIFQAGACHDSSAEAGASSERGHNKNDRPENHPVKLPKEKTCCFGQVELC